MAFKLGDLIVDRIVSGVAESTDGTQLLYLLTNLQEASINVTADSVDAVDGTGTIIKTFYRGKQGEFTATNSTLSLPIINAMGGTDATYAEDAALEIPMIITTASSSDIELPGISSASEFTASSIVVNAVSENGTLGDAYDVSALTFAAPKTGSKNGTLAITAANGDSRFIIKYNRTVKENGIKIANHSDKFPKTVKLTLKVLIVDPCEPDVVRAAYVVLPSFQPSAEIDFTISTDATLDFTGKLQAKYCGSDKVLYEIYVCSDDEEDAA